MSGLGALIKVACDKKMAGLAASHVIKNGAVALSPWAIRSFGLIPTVLSIILPPLTEKYVIPIILDPIIPAMTKKGSVSRLLWTVLTGKP